MRWQRGGSSNQHGREKGTQHGGWGDGWAWRAGGKAAPTLKCMYASKNDASQLKKDAQEELVCCSCPSFCTPGPYLPDLVRPVVNVDASLSGGGYRRKGGPAFYLLRPFSCKGEGDKGVLHCSILDICIHKLVVVVVVLAAVVWASTSCKNWSPLSRLQSPYHCAAFVFLCGPPLTAMSKKTPRFPVVSRRHGRSN